eukprot:4146424-Alexandrium_andersonii.AAC.1
MAAAPANASPRELKRKPWNRRSAATPATTGGGLQAALGAISGGRRLPARPRARSGRLPQRSNYVPRERSAKTF